MVIFSFFLLTIGVMDIIANAKEGTKRMGFKRISTSRNERAGKSGKLLKQVIFKHTGMVNREKKLKRP